MPTARRNIQIFNAPTPYPQRALTFRGGLVNRLPDELIKDSEISAGENYIPDISSTSDVVHRAGHTKHSTTALTEAGTSIFEGKNANYVSTSTIIRSLVGTSLATGYTSSTNPDWASFIDNDIFCNGTEVHTSTNGTTFAGLGGTPPAFKYLAAHNNILYGAGHSLGVLRWADVGTATTWSATNGLNITNDENDDIMALTKYRSTLVVFCENSFHHVNGFTTNDVGVVRSWYGVGCTSHRSVVVMPDFLAWWTNQGLAVSASGSLTDIQFPFRDRIPNTLASLNKAYYSLVHCVWNPNEQCIHCYVFSSAATTVDTRIDYYYNEDGGTDHNGRPLGTCWVQTGTGVAAGASGLALSSGDPVVYVVPAATTGNVNYINTAALSDDGTNISAFLETKRDYVSGPDSLKRLVQILTRTNVLGVATIILGIYIDDDSSIAKEWTKTITPSGGIYDISTYDSSAVYGSGNVSVDVPFAWPRRFRKVKFRASDNNLLRTRLRGISHKGIWISQ